MKLVRGEKRKDVNEVDALNWEVHEMAQILLERYGEDGEFGGTGGSGGGLGL